MRRYDYQYDALNRLTNGIYSEPNTSVPQNNFFNETMSYDINGNITTLKRNSKSAANTAELIDDLSYSYIGNRLNTVTENQPNYRGYPDVSGNTIAYDDNGNMTSQKDKGILKIGYNFLDLPSYITFDKQYYTRGVWQNVNTNYTYRADGTKLKKVYKYSENSVFKQKTTEYLDGFQYEIISPSGDPLIKFVSTSEGYFNFENNKYIYNYTDHLGNVRLSFLNNGSGAEVLEENNYYPFGLKHEGYNILTGNPANQNKYNGKELQEFGMYDYGARFYMADIGRWGVVDPLAEMMTRHSPYNYAFNNPIRFIDPDGREAKDITIPFGTDPKDVKAIRANLQKLTRDKLSTTKGVNGALHVFVDKFEKNGKYETGNQLIRELITDSHVVKIRAGKSNFAEAKNKESASNGVGTDSDITFNTSGKQDTRVFAEGDKTMYETSPNFVILGHELIHTKDHFNGTLDKTDAEHSFLDLKGIRLIESHPKSEFRASGFPGFEGKDGFSENNIRKEHGLKLRASYGYFKGRIR